VNIYLAFSLFSLIILLYWVISELFTIFFRFTGLPEEKARFQVISLLTGCGFTTRESEMVLTNRRRRRLARITMLFGYVFNITIVSAFINVFFSLKLAELGDSLLVILIPLGVVAVIFVFIRVPAVRAWGDKVLEGFANRMIRSGTGNLVMPLDYLGKDSIALVTLRFIPEEYRGVSLAQTHLKADTGILVMLVEGRDGKTVPAGADTVFHLGDKLTVFGDYATICRTFHARESFAEEE
jgi:hypothetical protein